MKCQLCTNTITPVTTQGVEIYKCEGCNGFWIKRGDLNLLIDHQRGDLEFSSVDHHFHKDTHGTLKCAFCDDSAMIKINFIGYSDIILDYCEECGAFWVDAGELEKMQEYISGIESGDKKKSLAEIIISVIYSLPQI